jgi:diguanylate cyclase (GGDEF)-like protein/PAS domain S-box-containing protein
MNIETRLFKSLSQQLVEAARRHDLKFDMAVQDAIELWRVLFEQSAEGLVVLDESGRVVEVNQRYAEMLGYSIDEMLQLHVWDWDIQFDKSALVEMLKHVDQTGAWFETQQRRKDGSIIDVGLSNNGARYQGRKLIFCICRDITKEKADQEKIIRLATIDTLTGLYNRYEFNNKYRQELDRAKRYNKDLSILMYDLDHFKKVNDEFGHDAGDSVLIRVSELVKQNIRAVDIAGRWGGEEFLVLLPEVAKDQARTVAEKLRRLIAEWDFERPSQVTVSFGVAQYEPGEDAEDLMRRLDKALYLAKENGRNRVECM